MAEEPAHHRDDYDVRGSHPLWDDRVAAVCRINIELNSNTSSRYKLIKTRELLNAGELNVIEKIDTYSDYFLKAIQAVVLSNAR